MHHFAAFLLALSLAYSAQAQTVRPPAAATVKPTEMKRASPKATTASRPAPEAGGPCIGVIPVIGDRFAVKKIGITVFGNEYKEITVDSWGLDDLVVERVRAAVGPGMVARRIPYAKGTFDSYDPGRGLFHTNDAKSAALVRQAAGPTGCARYVVVTRSSAQLVGNQGIGGIGIVNAGGPLLNKSFVHAVVHIDVHDGRTFAVLKRASGSLTGHDLPSLEGPPTRKLDDFVWPEVAEGANTAAMRATTRALLGEILDKSLPPVLAP